MTQQAHRIDDVHDDPYVMDASKIKTTDGVGAKPTLPRIR
jgi:hypothetical protein